MMNLVSVDSLAKGHSDKLLFESVTFGIAEGEKFALIGVNGCGKTTLLNIIAGIEEADRGTVSRNRELKIAFLQQNPPFNPAETIEQYLFGHVMQEEEQWRAKALLTGLGINELSLKMGELSGGMRKKAAITKALWGDSNLLILDEPTNHLDIDAILLIQEELRNTKKAILMVTHDRAFLDAVATTIFELDRRALNTYRGNYAFYLEKRAEREASLARTEDKIENILRTELEWLRRGPQARGTKSQDRKDRIMRMVNREKIAAPGTIELSISGRRLGKKIVEARNLTKQYGSKTVVRDFSWTFKKNQKLGIVGPNGCGKTTLLNLITGTVEPDSGDVEIGVNTCFGYFDQMGQTLDPNMRLIDFIKTAGEIIELADGSTITASQMLEKFLFSQGSQYQKIEKLSGGEKRRLQLLHVLMKNPNFLILDEPTNDLDIKTLSILEDFLQRFEGCLLVVSHDRYFLDHCCEFLLSFDEDGSVSGFACDMSDYLEMRELQKNAPKEPEKKVQQEMQLKPRDMDKKPKLTYKERLDLEALPAEIEALEAEKAQVEALLSGGETDTARLAELGRRYESLIREIDTKMERWSLLSEKEG